MPVKKIYISDQKFDINLKFYYFLKLLVKIKLSDKQCQQIFSAYCIAINVDNLADKKLVIVNTLKINPTSGKFNYFLDIFEQIETIIDLELFIFSLKLFLVKYILLAESKSRKLLDTNRLTNIHPLSLEYDKITLYAPYSQRVNGALLSLLFFEAIADDTFLANNSHELINSLAIQAKDLLDIGIEPNQIFMLLFNESINQSIISDSGSNYEQRILTILLAIGFGENQITTHVHDIKDKSTEFDFYFELNNKKYGIGAKRTLRERYKQFIKTSSMAHLDVMIEITLGTDLTPEKVKSILDHQVFLFVAPEIYQQSAYLHKLPGVFSANELTKATLLKLPQLVAKYS